MIDRRQFLAGAASAGYVFSGGQRLNESQDVAMPSRSLHDTQPEKYWAEIRRQFPIPANIIHLNNATIGSCPVPVLQSVFDGYRETEKLLDGDPEDYQIWGYDTHDAFRKPFAEHLGVATEEIALIHNATEGCGFIAHGLDLNAGDEVLMTDQEHPAGEQPFQLLAKRHGIVVRKVTIPRPLLSAADVTNRFNDAITPRTKAILVSHVSWITGAVFPVKEICTLARSKGIISAVDGAQVIGTFRANLRDLGCDLYTGSPHKWLMAPKGTGFLYVRNETVDRIWNTITNSGWLHPELRAGRFQQFGTGNMPCLWGLRRALQFAGEIGFDRIELRTRELATYLMQGLKRQGVELLASPDADLRCGIIAANVPGIKRMELERWLWSERRIRIRGGEPNRIRVSPGYYVQKAEIDRFLECLDEYRKRVA
jgi:isopenicillin-N epimerase